MRREIELLQVARGNQAVREDRCVLAGGKDIDDVCAGLDLGGRSRALRAMRTLAPEVLQSAKVQRWAPEELLRTLVEAEIVVRDEANGRARLRAAAFPARRTLGKFKVQESAVPQTTFDYLASLECIGAHENLVLVGPAGTGRSHLLVALGQAAVEAGLRVRYFAAVDLVEQLYRGRADNSVGPILDALLHADLLIVDELGFAPLDAVDSQLFFRFVAAAYEHKSLAVASHWPFEEWGRFFPETVTATSLLDRLVHHATVVVTSGESFRMREARSRPAPRAKTASAPAEAKPAKTTR